MVAVGFTLRCRLLQKHRQVDIPGGKNSCDPGEEKTKARKVKADWGIAIPEVEKVCLMKEFHSIVGSTNLALAILRVDFQSMNSETYKQHSPDALKKQSNILRHVTCLNGPPRCSVPS